ncbi:hypothetical protein [Caulobacter sp. Root1455]|uniref:hypothetical protein n=1 Tax=Caulobacter sp. Root1455 TaxID=1736465 RepID=UPI000A40A7F3|nr:hypothetical protein [Caulobacter sp. Root1455]
MSKARRMGGIMRGLTSALALATVGVAGVTLWELQFAERFGREAPDWIPLGSVYGGKAHAVVKALETDPTADLEPAKALSWRQLKLSPANHYAWLRLAFIEVAQKGSLGSDGVRYLQRSYDVAPYDSLAWRMGMAFETWPSLPKDLQDAVLDDLRVNWLTGRRRLSYSSLPSKVRNPAGLAVLQAKIVDLRREEAERYRQRQLLKRVN